MKMKCDIETIRQQLDQAIDTEDVSAADELTELLLRQQGMRSKLEMPENFPQEIYYRDEQEKLYRPGGHWKRILLILAAALTLLLSLGVISYAAGWLFPETENKDGSKTPVNAAIESEEYKAAQEYVQYLDGLDEKEKQELYDLSENAVYDVPDKVKALCEKYRLRYASVKTEFGSYEEAQRFLEGKHLSGILDEDLTERLKADMKESCCGYYFDDGNVHLEMEVKGDGETTDSIFSLNLTPKGSFPWMGFMPDEGMQGLAETSQIQSGNGSLFTWVNYKEMLQMQNWIATKLVKINYPPFLSSRKKP